ncbi:hypothetical protein C8J57DRAFT_1251837 [Mycena rebaudengoi]|nr:hypothetical protein C8J57DRAFT_1251837 [Mycena rebaudengoi]
MHHQPSISNRQRTRAIRRQNAVRAGSQGRSCIRAADLGPGIDVTGPGGRRGDADDERVAVLRGRCSAGGAARRAAARIVQTFWTTGAGFVFRFWGWVRGDAGRVRIWDELGVLGDECGAVDGLDGDAVLLLLATGFGGACLRGPFARSAYEMGALGAAIAVNPNPIPRDGHRRTVWLCCHP